MKMFELVGRKGPLGVSEAARLLGWKKSSAHRILSTFEMMGYFQQDQETGKYSLGFKIFKLTENFRGLTEIRGVALPFLFYLQRSTGETINLGILDGEEVVFVERISSNHVLQTIIPMGSKAPLHCTAIGKLFLAELEEKIRLKVLHSIKKRRYTPNTLVSIRDLSSEISRTKGRGYAMDNEEFHLGVRSVAAPIIGPNGILIAGVSVIGPSSRLNLTKLRSCATRVCDIANKISVALKGRMLTDEHQLLLESKNIAALGG